MRVERPVLVLHDDDHVHDAHGAAVLELDELVGDLALEVLVAGRELDDEVVDGPELVEGAFGHGLVLWSPPRTRLAHSVGVESDPKRSRAHARIAPVG